MAQSTFTLPKPRGDAAPYFSRNQVSKVLHQVGVLLELDGANVFRIRSYQNGSRTLGTMNQDLWELVQTKELINIKGIGKGLASAISEAMSTGLWPEDWIRLHEETAPGLIEMLGIPGMGPKKIQRLNQEFGVESIAGLKEVAEDGKIAPLSGFGAKSQQKILDGIELLARFRSRRRLDIGLMYGLAFESRISEIENVKRATLAGSARRRKSTIGDLDIVVSAESEHHAKISEDVLSLPGIADVKGAGDSKISLILDTSLFMEEFTVGHIDKNVLDAIGGAEYEQLESGGTIDAQIRIVEPHIEPFTLAYFTGSKEHNIVMRQKAIEKGLTLSEWGLSPHDKIGDLKGEAAAKFSLPAVEESDIYKHLGMEYVEPELREDLGEISAAQSGSLPNLVTLNQIKGSLHNHTTLSDGEASLEEMAHAARGMGWEWLGIADHSPTLKIANGASADDLLEQGARIKRYNSEWEEQGVDFRLIHGVESDILAGGKLDHPDEVLEQLDYVVASVHAMTKWRARSEFDNTEEMCKVIDHPSTTILGHPTGRILQGRDGYEIDLQAVLEHMADYNANGKLKAVELNASPYRLDLDWKFCKRAKDLGVPVIINPDAHSISGLNDIRFGVMNARKGWLESSDVLNSLDHNEIFEILAK